MGKTYKKQPHRYDDESSQRSGRGGMKTLNSYVDEDTELNDKVFNDDIELTDEIQIQHIQKNNP